MSLIVPVAGDSRNADEGCIAQCPRHVESWRKGRIDFLERVIQVNLKKVSLSMAMFRQRALAHGLKPNETRYVRRTRTRTVDLQFSKSGDPDIEKSYRAHYVSPALSEAQTTADHRKLANAQDEPSKTIYQNALDRLQTEKSSASAK